ncbi:MAG: HEAT repeat domain-containing protein [Hyphomonadaceae bacterium]
MTPDEMIERLLDPSFETDDGAMVNDLLGEFWRGYPVENIRRLLVPAAIGDAAFLVAELGQKVRPLLSDVADLMEHESPRIRFDAISALSQSTTWEDGWAVAKIVRALGDPHDGVRRMACKALRYMESSQVCAGLDYLKSQEPASVFAKFKNAFLAIERYPKKSAATLEKLLTSDDPIARRFGAAMAVRPRLFIDPAFVALTEAVEDAEVKKLVLDATAAPLPPWVEWNAAPRTE